MGGIIARVAALPTHLYPPWAHHIIVGWLPLVGKNTLGPILLDAKVSVDYENNISRSYWVATWIAFVDHHCWRMPQHFHWIWDDGVLSYCGWSVQMGKGEEGGCGGAGGSTVMSAPLLTQMGTQQKTSSQLGAGGTKKQSHWYFFIFWIAFFLAVKSGSLGISSIWLGNIWSSRLVLYFRFMHQKCNFWRWGKDPQVAWC